LRAVVACGVATGGSSVPISCVTLIGIRTSSGCRHSDPNVKGQPGAMVPLMARRRAIPENGRNATTAGSLQRAQTAARTVVLLRAAKIHRVSLVGAMPPYFDPSPHRKKASGSS
jgi:hypothetical protein